MKKHDVVKQRRIVLKNFIPAMVQHIANNINRFISDGGIVGTLDYNNGEKYSCAHRYSAFFKGKKFRVSYRFYVGIVEE